MFGSRPLRRSECERVLVLLGALALSLLVVLGAQAGTPRVLLENLQRDLGALRVQLEQVEAWLPEDRHAVSLATDIGDGTPAFRRQTLSTILRSAYRRLDRLSVGSPQAGGEGRATPVERLRLGLVEMQVRFDRLFGASDPAQAAKARAAAVALLDELDQTVVLLLRSGNTGFPGGAPPRGT
jgi:hypothetical protein